MAKFSVVLFWALFGLALAKHHSWHKHYSSSSSDGGRRAKAVPEAVAEVVVEASSVATDTTDAKKFIQVGHKFYWIDATEKMNWFKALHTCRKMNAHLATIENEFEMNALNQYLVSQKLSDNRFWLAGNDLAEENNFMWVSNGEQMDYSKWSSGQPDNMNANEHCSQLWQVNGEYQMNDQSCMDSFNVICEADMQCAGGNFEMREEEGRAWMDEESMEYDGGPGGWRRTFTWNGRPRYSGYYGGSTGGRSSSGGRSGTWRKESGGDRRGSGKNGYSSWKMVYSPEYYSWMNGGRGHWGNAGEFGWSQDPSTSRYSVHHKKEKDAGKTYSLLWKGGSRRSQGGEWYPDPKGGRYGEWSSSWENGAEEPVKGKHGKQWKYEYNFNGQEPKQGKTEMEWGYDRHRGSKGQYGQYGGDMNSKFSGGHSGKWVGKYHGSYPEVDSTKGGKRYEYKWSEGSRNGNDKHGSHFGNRHGHGGKWHSEWSMSDSRGEGDSASLDDISASGEWNQGDGSEGGHDSGFHTQVEIIKEKEVVPGTIGGSGYMEHNQHWEDGGNTHSESHDVVQQESVESEEHSVSGASGETRNHVEFGEHWEEGGNTHHSESHNEVVQESVESEEDSVSGASGETRHHVEFGEHWEEGGNTHHSESHNEVEQESEESSESDEDSVSGASGETRNHVEFGEHWEEGGNTHHSESHNEVEQASEESFESEEDSISGGSGDSGHHIEFNEHWEEGGNTHHSESHNEVEQESEESSESDEDSYSGASGDSGHHVEFSEHWEEGGNTHHSESYNEVDQESEESSESDEDSDSEASGDSGHHVEFSEHWEEGGNTHHSESHNEVEQESEESSESDEDSVSGASGETRNHVEFSEHWEEGGNTQHSESHNEVEQASEESFESEEDSISGGSGDSGRHVEFNEHWEEGGNTHHSESHNEVEQESEESSESDEDSDSGASGDSGDHVEFSERWEEGGNTHHSESYNEVEQESEESSESDEDSDSEASGDSGHHVEFSEHWEEGGNTHHSESHNEVEQEFEESSESDEDSDSGISGESGHHFEFSEHWGEGGNSHHSESDGNIIEIGVGESESEVHNERNIEAEDESSSDSDSSLSSEESYGEGAGEDHNGNNGGWAVDFDSVKENETPGEHNGHKSGHSWSSSWSSRWSSDKVKNGMKEFMDSDRFNGGSDGKGYWSVFWKQIGQNARARKGFMYRYVDTTKYVMIGEKYYWIQTGEKVNWHAAQHNCRMNGGNLATIQSEEEMKAIDEYLRSQGLSSYFWVAGNDLSKEGEFRWISNGQPMSYSKWSVGQPDNAGNNENCVHLWVKENEYHMNDNRCHAEIEYICEAEPTCFAPESKQEVNDVTTTT